MRCKRSEDPQKKAAYDRERRARIRAQRELGVGKPLGRNQWTVGHRMAGTTEYKTWSSMRRRCGNPLDKDYAHYGGRGIRVCDHWCTFDAFFADMGPRPRGMTLGRINNDGNYEPSNCRWETVAQQNLNRRCSVVVEFCGNRLSLQAWSSLVGIGYHTLHSRLFTKGWPVERALTEPVRRR